jgi:hypothetical protein
VASFTENRQRQNKPNNGVLLFLTVEADSFTGPLEIVADTQDWDSNGVTYTGVPFGFTLPDDVPGQSSRAQLVMSNVGGGVSEELELLGPNEIVTATFQIADRSAPDTIFREIPVPLVGVSVSGATVAAQCGWDHIMRQQAVRIRAGSETVARP